MHITYQCQGVGIQECPKWTGSMEVMGKRTVYELEVHTRGSYFHILTGRHGYGNYLCIPNWNIGMELSGFDDRYWIYEKLCNRGIGLADANSIADALKALGEYQKSDRAESKTAGGGL